MNQSTLVVISAILLLATVSTSVASFADGTSNLQECIPNGQYNASVNYFPVRTVISNSTLFNVTYTNSYKVVTDTADGTTYVLYQCGSPKPDASLFAAGAKFFSVPVTKVLTSQTPNNPYLLLLGLQSKIKYVDSAAYICSPCVQMALEKGEILPYNSSAVPSQMDSVDVAFTYMKDNKTNTVMTRESTDPGPLHRAGWLQFYAFFFNAENVSKTVFGGISDNYHCFANATRITLDARRSTMQKVAWASYSAPSKYNGNKASWTISAAAYKAKITADGGAQLAPALTTSNSSEFLAALADVDVLIDETYMISNYSHFMSEYRIDPNVTNFKFIKQNRVYRQDGLMNSVGSRDWLESGISYDDAVMQEFVRITYPVVLPTAVKPLWFRNLATGEQPLILTSANCTNYNDIVHIYKDRVINCAAMPLNLSSSPVLLPSLITLFAAVLISMLIL
ncbi:hypothetical protein SAMD00019534_014970 [Acytostelium subglobosum LB1]|uniref:hypothetical protein n=1 Tax=Acytostelium subglobosum LB1 TaxID=1410327 RepID=UPI0006451769|nr:hypothetical protein SAMD00019534_014970 [Acytostelium subglobosum LB1]GAM18322.1 hypothetical protein SAMD00019534_014970 [Acytostelium subglobosum LB1]|eukprot:XP_012757542.1 hypothetical protein SAMD00019534_014970 [Acytostelium subglobosum LB1]